MEISTQILLVDDSRTQALHLKQILEKNDLSTFVAHSGRDAINLIQKQNFDLIITDVIMPDMDGYELCKQIKLDEKNKTIPVVLLTSLSDPKDIIKGLQCGADNFIPKSFDEKYLISKIKNILMNFEIRKEQKSDMAVELEVAGAKFKVTSDKLQILDLLFTTYDTALQTSLELNKAQEELKILNLKLKENMQELNRSNKELEQFAYIASHDLQEPLRKIVSYSDLLKTTCPENLNEESNLYIDKIQSASRRMQVLIQDLLQYSRTGTKEKELEELDLNQLVKEVLSDLETRINDTKAKVEVDELPVISADKIQMRQLFQNLISNAIKYSKKDVLPVVKIKNDRLNNGDVEISVEDNGIGFDETNASKIFEPFKRLHTKSEYEGTGIGLAICQKIVDRHNGHIRAISKIGEGSKFVFKLPRTSILEKVK